MTVKYKVKNMDCAVCAERIETELSKERDVNKIHVDPINSIIETDLQDIIRLNKLVKNIEPAAEIEEIQKNGTENEPKKIRGEIIQMSIVVVLLLTGIIFRYDLKENVFSFADWIVFITAYLISGWGVISRAFKNILSGKVFDEHFLMTIATGGAIIIGELPEAVTVMLFYNVGEYLQSLAVQKNRKSVKALLSIRPDYANLVVGSDYKKISPEEVKINETIIVKPGEKIPLDGIIANGNSYVDTFALTGESVPRSVKPGDEVLSGMINKHGIITIKVTKNFSESSFTKIINLVEGASKRKAETERFISSFAFYYTPAVAALALLVAFMPPLFIPGQTLQDWIYRALVMLVVACPCALVISIPLSYFGGIGGASRKGILIKGSNFLDALTAIRTIVFDKTGTLTKGVFKVTGVMLANSFRRDDLLRFAAHAEYLSGHPIAQSILNEYQGEIDTASIKDYTEFPGKGIKALVADKEIIAGNESLLMQENIFHDSIDTEGTIVHIAINKIYAGYLVISDELKDKAAYTMQKLSEFGIKKIMLTGDNEISTRIIAEKLHIDKYYSGLLPEDKVKYLEKIMADNPQGKTAFVGDGINDAPVIARSDIGFAMGGLGSDAAVEASDIVIMEDDPSKIIDAINIAGKTRMIVWQNIFFAIGVKLLFIILGGMGIATMWEAVFGDMGVALIAIINSARAFRN